MRSFANLLAAAVFSMSVPQSARAVEFITNGGFETGNFTPNGSPTYDIISSVGAQDLTGWTVGNSLVWGVNATDINTHAGAGFVDLTGIGNTVPHGILNQTLGTAIGTSYVFSAFTTLDIQSQSVGIIVSVNGVPLALTGPYGVWNYSPTGAIWSPVSATFTATSASSVLSIAGQSGFSFMIGIDDVSVTGPERGAVPEPSTWAMMLVGFGCVGIMCARQRRKHVIAGDRTVPL